MRDAPNPRKYHGEGHSLFYKFVRAILFHLEIPHNSVISKDSSDSSSSGNAEGFEYGNGNGEVPPGQNVDEDGNIVNNGGNNEDLVGVEILPIAELFAGDYVCLDYRKNKEKPSICVWSHEESEDFAPVTYKAADTFSEFIEMLR